MALRICTVIVVGGLRRNYFCSDATLVQKKLLRRLWRGLQQNHFARKKLLRCFNSTKRMLQRLRRGLRRDPVSFASNRFLLQSSKKQGFFFASRKQFRNFSAKHFCSIHTIFFTTMNRFLLHWYIIEAKAGLRKSRETRVSRTSRRISGQDPSEDAQSLP
jgi:hypothetical protein